jgi:hypothetical protein
MRQGPQHIDEAIFDFKRGEDALLCRGEDVHTLAKLRCRMGLCLSTVRDGDKTKTTSAELEEALAKLRQAHEANELSNNIVRTCIHESVLHGSVLHGSVLHASQRASLDS